MDEVVTGRVVLSRGFSGEDGVELYEVGNPLIVFRLPHDGFGKPLPCARGARGDPVAVLEHRHEQLSLGGEMVEERGLVDPCPVRDVLDAAAVVAP
ncbi:hypothetical protein D9M72_493700 [compost metagenome]